MTRKLILNKNKFNKKNNYYHKAKNLKYKGWKLYILNNLSSFCSVHKFCGKCLKLFDIRLHHHTHIEELRECDRFSQMSI